VPPSACNLTAPASIDLHRVRQLFSVPERVAESNFLRREISARMSERLALVKIAPQRILDAGCGEGADLPLLQTCYGNAHRIGVDASAAMLTVADSKQTAAQSLAHRFLPKWLRRDVAPQGSSTLVCGNFAQLPLKANTIDMVWSNLALHWHTQPDRVFAEWQRVLSVDGLLMFSCLGPDTFKQLRMAFATVDQASHVLPFVDMHDLGDMLLNAGFATPVMDMEIITVTYPTVDKLMADVRAWGGNPLSIRRSGLLGRNDWARVIRSLEALRNADGKIPLTFEVIYGHAFRPRPWMTAQGEAIIRFDLPRK